MSRALIQQYYSEREQVRQQSSRSNELFTSKAFVQFSDDLPQIIKEGAILDN